MTEVCGKTPLDFNGGGGVSGFHPLSLHDFQIKFVQFTSPESLHDNSADDLKIKLCVFPLYHPFYHSFCNQTSDDMSFMIHKVE